MAQRVPWDISEAVIMLDALIAVRECKISRNDAIATVSSELRTRARKKGMEIDEIFRNINGITFQMSRMEYILTDGEKGMKNSSKLFREIVAMYQNDRSAYEKILKEARSVASTKSQQEQYFTWLATQVSPAQLSELYIAYSDIEKFCLQRGIIRKKLFELTELSDIRKVSDTVNSNKVFRFTYKGSLSKMNSAMYFYYRFMKEHPDLLKRKLPIKPAEKPEPVKAQEAEPVGKPIRQRETAVLSNTEDKTDFRLDFTNIQSMAFTRPTEFSYFDEVRGKVGSWTELYVQIVKCLLDDYPHLLYSYINCNIGGQVRYDFADESGMSSMVAPKRVFDDFFIETNISATDIARKIKKLLNLCNIDYENLEVLYRKQGTDKTDIITERKKAGNFASEIVKPPQISKSIRERFMVILREHFNEDGYQPGRAIFRGRFKRFYSEKYGCAPPETDERIDEILSVIGSKRHDRIFPKQDDIQNDLIAEIEGDVLSALNSGATAVYIDAVYDKYRQPLADELHIYNQDALVSLLLVRADGKYRRRYSYLTNNRSSANTREDLVRIMKEFHQPQDYAAIHEKAWFIPYEKMKTVLVTTTSIVNVAAETYFYAPNLPVSAEELAHLSSLMNEELSYRGYITDVRLKQIIAEKCGSIAINTDGYTTYGLRNCLGYIFRDRFAFNGPIITLKGNEMSMADVFTEFAKEHEKLSVDELSALSNEMNITIYWDSVLSEMVRVSAEDLVRKDLINFDIEATDDILDGMCSGDYIPLTEVDLFLHFPNIGYPWNSYLLESYLFGFSRKFRLLHSSFIKTGVYGAMVRKESTITDYRSLLVDILSKSNALDSADAALKYIVNKGYQQRKRYEGIETIIREAKLIKERRKKQEK